MKIKYIFLFSFIFLSSCTISNFDRGHFIPTDNEPVEIEFEVLSDLIIIKAEINGVSGNFLFDNGFSLSAVNQEFANRAHIDFNNSSNMRDVNNNRARTPESTVDSVVISNQTFIETGFYRTNTSSFFPCDSIDGIIGASIINKANWKINFEKKKIQISSLPFKEKGNKLPISFSNNNSSFTTISILGIPYKCKIDLGNTKSLEIDRTYAKGSYEGLLAEKRIGITSISSNGLGKSDTVYYLSENLQLSHLDNNLPVQTRVLIKDKLKYQGYIGINYLNDYEEVIINSTEKEYVLVNPKESLPAEVDSSFGVALYPIDKVWKIIQIDSHDSALSKIELMDEVIMIDSLPVSRFENICAYKEYIKMKINKNESLMIYLKDSISLELPFRKNKIQKIPVYNKK